MARSWTLGRKITAGFALVAALAVAIGVTALWAVGRLAEASERMGAEAEEMVQATKLQAIADKELAELRGFLLSGEERFLAAYRAADEQGDKILATLVAQANDAESKRLLQEIDRADEEHRKAVATFLESRQAAISAAKASEMLDHAEGPKLQTLDRTLDVYVNYEQQTLDQQKQEQDRTASRARGVVLAVTLAVFVLAAGISVGLSRGLSRDIGDAVQHVQSSSTELQAAANQQAAASKEQAAATNETTTTIKELVATARQIAESAQRVSQVAEQTVQAAKNGDQTVRKAQEGLDGIKRQVDLIVSHMLELGRKSQHIGGILEVINELAEQTNILAINATIEAAGAGDTGKRFAVVADEIRKLADRVGGSTKDIRTLVEEIRTAVNTTVMATEQGTKAVDAGARQVGEVAASFSHIVGMVATTTEVAREIELSTKQQTTAVEQVNLAMVNVAQAAKETEATSSETLQTASQLTTLSRALTRMIQAVEA